LPGTIALARSFRAQAVGDVAGAADQARRALNLLPEDDHVWRGGAALLLALAPGRAASARLRAAHRTLRSSAPPDGPTRPLCLRRSHVLEIALDLIVTPVRIALATATPATATW
jgi:hypothetical protein